MITEIRIPVCMICGASAREYLNCFIDEGGCGEYAWCDSEACAVTPIRGRCKSDIIWNHIDHDGCDGECCENRHVMLSHRTICNQERQLTFSDHLLFTVYGAYYPEVAAWV